ncbi:heme exporter protein CcmB [Allohahella marinimesophila]|uniref:Heme exporter protein B n=1 Tax=Allohahella marinimesophila TaxID=1054972 RepID=A0ABP7NM84_9GAMM
MSTLLTVIRHDMKLAFRRPADFVNALAFFVIALTLFPLGVSPEDSFLVPAAAGLIWVAALLATLLSLNQLFESDAQDGTLEQLLVSGQPLFAIALCKVAVHWVVTGLPVILMTPLLAVMLQLPADLLPVLLVSMLLGTPVLSLIGGIGSALTLGLRGAHIITSLIVLPMYVPVLLFATGAVLSAQAGAEFDGQLAVLGALLALALALAPFAIAAALRISVSQN